ncbi:MAG TPA: ergothioneine biosynthesis protein EgtB [Rhodanobacteraceae bacterium]|nr:ergothioneine biosynthesis protein EgtB [Rhodanobacteraceae bacterium]
MNAQPSATVGHLESLDDAYHRVRDRTVDLCAGLSAEDTVVQSMPDASPTKWHLAHTTWFFEQFVLGRRAGYRPVQPEWAYLFNSYYQTVGPMHARPQRGLLSRPTLVEVLDYRRRVDERMQHQFNADGDDVLAQLVTLGLNHEQQHQELLLTDIKHAFSVNPLEPVYRALPDPVPPVPAPVPLEFVRGRDGIVDIGADGEGFAFDNERPRHRELLHPHAIATRPVTNAEYREFIHDDGYATPALWMAEGWAMVQERGWNRPLYWSEDRTSEFTLAGRRDLDARAPVCHVSFYEADAFARWSGMRLPTETEWENLAADQPSCAGNFLDSGLLHPQPARDFAADVPLQMFGDVWEWTSSPYVSYPRFRRLPGALGEYNGKFMCGQWVLRGGSCATPADHIRATYRNFFNPADRWQFMGIRLGKDA